MTTRTGLSARVVAFAFLSAAACSSSSNPVEATDGAPLPGDGASAANDAGSVRDGPVADAASSGAPDASSDGTMAACAIPPDDGGTCFSVQALGPLITETCVSGEPPEAQGGTIENGTYVLDSFGDYGGCPTTPEVVSTTWDICGPNWVAGEIAPNTTTPDAGNRPDTTFAFVATVQGTSVSFGKSCGPMDALPMRGFTATSTGLAFIYPSQVTAGAIVVSHYARQ